MIHCNRVCCSRLPYVLLGFLVLMLVAGDMQGATVRIHFDKNIPQVAFAAAEIGKTLRDRGSDVVTADLASNGGSVVGARVYLLDQSDARQLAPAALQGPNGVGKMAPEGYALRTGAGSTCYVLGADAAGVMYGGLELAELIATGVALDDIQNVEHEPYMAMRGTKFNIPLDVRSPSYTDVSDVAQQNIPEMWSFEFWQEYIDSLARYRYNYVSLWSLHPFPSLVKCPDFPDIALDDVQRSTVKWKENYSLNGIGFDAPEILENVEVIKEMTIDDKIAFWRRVMRYGKQRNVDFYFVTWNIFVNGTLGKYGITDSIDNPTTVKYFRQSVKQMFLTYPDLAGIGLTTGENMPGAAFQKKEDWAFATYAQGVLDVLAEQPDRKITFIHRQHQTGAQDIARTFAPLIEHPNVEFIFSFKYAKAHVFSATKQPYHKGFVKDIGDLKTIWTLRNDDDYYFRWGAPDFVREFLQNIPHDVSRGFYYGSDQYIWGREFLSLEPESPRQIEIGKHWYHWMMWGRLGYDPTVSDDRFQQILQSRFPSVPADKLFTAWQEASMIYPLTTGFHWGSLDFQWYIEGCQSQPGPAETKSGFHDVNRFISLEPHAMAGCIGVEEYLEKKKRGEAFNGATPAQVSERIHASADKSLRILEELSPSNDKELRQTLNDIRTIAYLGKYYGHKIRAAQELGEYRQTEIESHRQRAIEELNAAARFWRYFASTALSQYKNPLWTNRVGHVDWRKTYRHVLQDVEIAGGMPHVASMEPTPGGTLLQAESGVSQGMQAASQRRGFSGSGYLQATAAAGDRSIEWSWNAPADATYVLEIQYALEQAGEYPCHLSINGTSAGDFLCWTTGGVDTWVWDRKVVALKQGRNTIRLTPDAAVAIDHVNVLSGAPER